MALFAYMCPNCGAPVKFESKTQIIKCPYCKSAIGAEELEHMGNISEDKMTADKPKARRSEPEGIYWVYDDVEWQENEIVGAEALVWDYAGSQWGADEQQGLAAYACPSCDGKIICDETPGSLTCPFCRNAVMLASVFSESLRPDIIIPFQADRANALKAIEAYHGEKRLLPKLFKNKNHLAEIQGIYVPCWIFDVKTISHIEYNSTDSRHWIEGQYNYTEHCSFRAIRDGRIEFAEVPVHGSAIMDSPLMESLEPFYMDEAVDFQAAYLSGHLAGQYDMDAKTAMHYAEERMKNSLESTFMQTVTGNETYIENARVRVKRIHSRYALLPVWLLTTNWQGKKFVFTMNGQTGKFVSDFPQDNLMRNKWFVAIFGIAAAALITLSTIVVSII